MNAPANQTATEDRYDPVAGINMDIVGNADRAPGSVDVDLERIASLSLAERARAQGVLNTDKELEPLAEKLKSYICGLTSVSQVGGLEGGEEVDRYGVFSTLARRTPWHVYDHPLLIAQCDTAFTDGISVWWSAPLLRKLFDDILQPKEADRRDGVIEVALHEHMHILLDHCTRLLNFPKDISGMATDIVINKNINELTKPSNPGKTWRTAWGLRPGHEIYDGMSEETVAKMLLKESIESGTLKIKKIVLKDAKPGSKSKGKNDEPTVMKIPKEGMDIDELVIEVDPDNVSDTIVQGKVEIGEVDDQRKNPKNQKSSKNTDRKKSQGKQLGAGKDDGQGGQDSNSAGDDASKDANNTGKPGKGGKDKGKDNDAGAAGNGPGSSGGKQQAGSGDPAGTRDGIPQPGKDDSGGDAPVHGKRDLAKSSGQGHQQQEQDGAAAGKSQGELKGEAKDLLGGGGLGSDHIIDINKVRDLLKQAGLDNVIDACKIPEPGQETEDAKNEARLSVVAAIEEAEQNRQRLSDASKYPGGHVLDYAVSVVKAAARPNATWKAKVRDFLMGEGAKVGRNLDTPDILYFVDPVDMGLPEGDDVYLPGPIPIKHPARFKVIMDSSGSMWDNKGSSRIGLFIALLIDVIEKSTELDPEIDVYMADTIVRGDPIRLTISDLERLKSNGLDVGGMGGTDFTVPLAQVCAQAKENQEEIGGILYLTDFGCTVPDFSVIPDIGDVPLLFAGVPQDFKHAEHLINGIEATGRAECASIEDNMILDFEAMEDRMTETRSAAAAPR